MELFLSHATSDGALVRRIRKTLSGSGVRVYTAEDDRRAGDNVHEKIDQAMRRCDFMVVLLTDAGNRSRYVHQEIGFAKRAGKLIVPVVTAEVALTGLGMLEGTEYILVNEADPSAALSDLASRIERLARQQRVDTLVMTGLIMFAVGAVIIAMEG